MTTEPRDIDECPECGEIIEGTNEDYCPVCRLEIIAAARAEGQP